MPLDVPSLVEFLKYTLYSNNPIKRRNKKPATDKIISKNRFKAFFPYLKKLLLNHINYLIASVRGFEWWIKF
jgi:hypothetical protein